MLTILEAGKFKVTVPTDSVSGKVLFFTDGALLPCPHVETAAFKFLLDLIPNGLTTSQKPPFLNSVTLRIKLKHEFGQDKHQCP